MRRLAYLLSILGAAGLSGMSHAATVGDGTLVNGDFTFSFEQEGPNDTFKALGTSDSALNRHLNQSRCLCQEKLKVRVVLSEAGRAKLAMDDVVGKLVFGAACDQPNVPCAPLGNEFTFTATKGELSAITNAQELFEAVAKDKTKACSDVEGNYAFWVILQKDGARLTTALPSKSLYLDSKPPEAPLIETLLPSDEGADVKWKAGPAGTLSGYQVVCSPNPAKTWAPAFTFCPLSAVQPPSASLRFCTEKTSSAATQVRVDGLENEMPYSLALISIDNSGNASPLSESKEVIPTPSLSFHDLYEDANGQAEGGCQMNPRRAEQGSSWLIGLALLAGAHWLLRRHRNNVVAALALLASAFDSSTAHADTLGIIEPPPRHEIDKLARTERGFNVNLGVGLYRPDVDSEFASDRPFATAFGNSERALWQLRVERLLWQKVGTLSLGLGAGYYRAEGKARLKKDFSKSNDETSFQVVPLTVDLGYQYDMWVRRGWGLMPFARAGLDRAFWFMHNEDSIDARGGTNGWHAAVGVAFAFDALDPESAQQLDSETGVNHTLIYAEYLLQDLSGLGSSKRLQLSDSMLSFGLSLQI